MSTHLTPQRLALTNTDPTTSCPIAPGPYTFTYVVSLPDHISPSKFTKLLLPRP